MPNLVEQLGTRYVRDFFADAYLQKGHWLFKLQTLDEMNRKVLTKKLDLREQNPKWVPDNETLKFEDLVDFSTFKYPKLGYRQYKQGKFGNLVVQIATVRAAQRGLRDDYIRYNLLPVFSAAGIGFVDDGFDGVNSARRIRELFNPSFTPFSVGINQLLRGEDLAFVVNEDLAVTVSCETNADRHFDVLFRGRIVGSVDETGKLTLSNKILQRDSVKRKLFK